MRRPEAVPAGWPVRRLLVALLVVALVTSGCSGGGDEPGGSASPSATAPPPPYLPVREGVELTPPGTSLAIGDKGVVAWTLRSGKRKGKVATLAIRVTSLEMMTFKKLRGWKISKEKRESTKPFFVRATVTNVGWGDLGERPVPLYLVDNTEGLVEPLAFATTFKPCPGRVLPRDFRPGDKAEVCLVFLSPGKGARLVTFRPRPKFDPVTWSRAGG